VNDLEPLIDLHAVSDRRGPGSDAETRRAIELARTLEARIVETEEAETAIPREHRAWYGYAFCIARKPKKSAHENAPGEGPRAKSG